MTTQYGHCQACCHWGPTSSYAYWQPVGICRLTDDDDADYAPEIARLMYPYADSSGQNRLVTKPTFGCVLFRPKEPAT